MIALPGARGGRPPTSLMRRPERLRAGGRSTVGSAPPRPRLTAMRGVTAPCRRSTRTRGDRSGGRGSTTATLADVDPTVLRSPSARGAGSTTGRRSRDPAGAHSASTPSRSTWRDPLTRGPVPPRPSGPLPRTHRRGRGQRRAGRPRLRRRATGSPSAADTPETSSGSRSPPRSAAPGPGRAARARSPYTPRGRQHLARRWRPGDVERGTVRSTRSAATVALARRSIEHPPAESPLPAQVSYVLDDDRTQIRRCSALVGVDGAARGGAAGRAGVRRGRPPSVPHAWR